jgi:hypothetical protein
MTALAVDPGDVWSMDLQRGELKVRAFADAMPASGATVTFAERRWVVTRRDVRAEGGRPCYFAALLPEAGDR